MRTLSPLAGSAEHTTPTNSHLAGSKRTYPPFAPGPSRHLPTNPSHAYLLERQGCYERRNGVRPGRRGGGKKPQRQRQHPPRQPLHLEQLSSMIRLNEDSVTEGTATTQQGIFSRSGLVGKGAAPPPGGGKPAEPLEKSPATASPSPAPASLKNDTTGGEPGSNTPAEAPFKAAVEGIGGDGKPSRPEGKHGESEPQGEGGKKRRERGSREGAPRKRGSAGHLGVVAVEADGGGDEAEKKEAAGAGALPPEIAGPGLSTQVGGVAERMARGKGTW